MSNKPNVQFTTVEEVNEMNKLQLEMESFYQKLSCDDTNDIEQLK